MIDTLKERSGRRDLDTADLIETVLSAKKPVLRVNGLAHRFDETEQRGWMQLFLGRNHGDEPHAQVPEQEALDGLSLMNLLYNKLTTMERVAETAPENG